MSNLLIKAIAARHHPSGGAFTPDSISGLVSWYDADQLTYNNLDLVDTWTDEKGSNDLTATSGNRGAYQTNYVNGHAAINFNQNHPDWYSNTSITVSQPNTWFFVFRIGNAENDDAAIFDYNGSGARQGLFSANAANPDIYSATAGSFISGGAVTKNSWVVAIFIVNGASSYVYESGTLKTSGNAGSNAVASLRLGLLGNNNSPFNGQFAELGCYSQALNDSDRGNLQSYLGTKYAITIS